MADPQEEARNKQAVPSGTTDHLEELKQQNADARGAYLKQQEELGKVAKDYGFASATQMMNRVTTDFVFAERLITDLVSGGDKKAKVAQLPDSSQENNLTGRLDHTVTPAVKVGEIATEPVNDGVTATESEPLAFTSQES